MPSSAWAAPSSPPSTFFGHLLRKALRQLHLHPRYHLWRPRDKILKQRFGVFSIADFFGRAIEVPALDVVYVVVPVLA
jgi:hypothetical protein